LFHQRIIRPLLRKNRGLIFLEAMEFSRAKEDYVKAAEISGDEIIKQKIRADRKSVV
jgi:hypothetical protein